MSNKITFSDYVKVRIYISDKNNVEVYNFFASNCNPNVDIKSLSNKEIESNVKFWSQLSNITSNWHTELDSYSVKDPITLTTEEWLKISDTLESAEYIEQSFYTIINILTGAPIEEIKEFNFQQPAEIINFFLQNYQKFTVGSLLYSQIENKKIKKTIINNLHSALKIQTQD